MKSFIWRCILLPKSVSVCRAVYGTLVCPTPNTLFCRAIKKLGYTKLKAPRNGIFEDKRKYHIESCNCIISCTKMEFRPSSSGYRFPSTSRPKSSEFHQNCVPAAVKKRIAQDAQQSAQKGGPDEGDFKNPVNEDKIWKKAVKTEDVAVKQWKENWGFMADYDQRGELKKEKEMPEKVNMFSDAVPNTTAGMVGRQLTSELGQSIVRMEFQFHSQNRKRRLDNEMVCY